MRFTIKVFPSSRAERIRFAVLLVLLVGLPAILLALMTRMPGHSRARQTSPPSAEENEIANRLRAHVDFLSAQIGERNDLSLRALSRAGDYLRVQLNESGYDAQSEAISYDRYTVHNVFAEVPGREPEAGVMVVGGHYDTVYGTPGADDNASGAAVTVELARLLRNARPKHTLRFVLFANEEPPHFQTPTMGSYVHARSLTQGTRVRAMLSIECVGFYSDAKGSQQYPFPFSFLYPNTGDFIGVVGNFQSRAFTRTVVGTLRANLSMPVEGVAAFSWIPGIGWSDHWAFWQFGIPAVMISDTAPFRNPNYHQASDRIETLDFQRMAVLTGGLRSALVEIDRAID